MALISQPGSDYQIASISLDAGYTRDLILMLTDVHAVLDHLYLDGTQPQITAPAEDYLRESASPYSLPALIDALGEVTGRLSGAEREALASVPAGAATGDQSDPRAGTAARSGPASCRGARNAAEPGQMGRPSFPSPCRMGTPCQATPRLRGPRCANSFHT